MQGTTEDLTRKVAEARRGVITFNGAGIAGAVGLLQRAGPAPFAIKAAAFAFLLGVIFAIIAWALGEPWGDDETDIEAGMRNTVIATYVSGAFFLLGATLCIVGVL